MRPRSLSDDILAAGVTKPHLAGSRELTDYLRKLRPRLDLLPASDRALVELCLTRQMTLREFARHFNLDPGSLSRRQRLLWRRLHHPLLDLLFTPTLPETLPPEYRQIGVEHHLLGLTLCDLADKHQMTKPQIQQILAYLQGVADTHSARR